MKRKVKKFLNNVGILDNIQDYNEKKYTKYLAKKLVEIGKDGIVTELPKVIVYEITSICNLNCKHCLVSKKLRSTFEQLDTENVKKMIDNLPESITTVIITGGEPFMRKDFLEILRYFKLKRIHVHLTTNGTFIDEAMMSKLKKIDVVIGGGISLDGLEELHNSIRGRRFAFERGIRGLKLMLSHFETSTVCVIQKDNITQLPELVKFANSIGMKKIRFEYFRGYTQQEVEVSNKMMDMDLISGLELDTEFKRDHTLEELETVFKKIKSASKKYNVKVKYFPYFLDEHLKMCYDKTIREQYNCTCRNLTAFRLDSMGNVIHCYGMRKVMGNLLTTPFKEIWNSPEYRKLRQGLIKNNLLPVCETCLYQRLISKK